MLAPFALCLQARIQALNAQWMSPWEPIPTSHLSGCHEEIPGQQCAQTQYKEDKPDGFVPGDGRGKWGQVTHHPTFLPKSNLGQPHPLLSLQLSQGAEHAEEDVVWDGGKGTDESREGGGSGT